MPLNYEFERKLTEIFQESFVTASNKAKNKAKGQLLHWGIGILKNDSISDRREMIFNLLNLIQRVSKNRLEELVLEMWLVIAIEEGKQKKKC